ncbi:Serine/arginine-rich splicing factor SR45a [Dionaea muscipula]
MRLSALPPDGSLSPDRGHRRRSRSPLRSDDDEAGNPGNNLYVTGLSSRVTESDLEKFFSKEGKVIECHLVRDPRSKESRGFGFVTMETTRDANSCVKYLHRSVLEGRLITVEKAKRSRRRTPTPGKYHGIKDRRGGRDHRRSHSYSPNRRGRRSDRDPYPHSNDKLGRSSRRADTYSESQRRPQDRSPSPGHHGNP